MIKKCVTDIMGSVDEYRVKTWAKLYGFCSEMYSLSLKYHEDKECYIVM